MYRVQEEKQYVKRLSQGGQKYHYESRLDLPHALSPLKQFWAQTPAFRLARYVQGLQLSHYWTPEERRELGLYALSLARKSEGN